MISGPLAKHINSNIGIFGFLGLNMKEASQAEQILKKTAECCENLSLKGNKKKKKLRSS